MNRLAPLSLIFFLIPISLFAADLTLEQRSVDENGRILIDVFVDTEQKNPINAASAIVSVPKDLFKIVDITTSDSIFNLWPESPKIEEDENEIHFAGGTSGAGGFIFKGKIMSFTILPAQFGTGVVELQNAEVLASNGDGTNILETTKNLPYTHAEGSLAARFDNDQDGIVSIQELSIGLVTDVQ